MIEKNRQTGPIYACHCPIKKCIWEIKFLIVSCSIEIDSYKWRDRKSDPCLVTLFLYLDPFFMVSNSSENQKLHIIPPKLFRLR